MTKKQRKKEKDIIISFADSMSTQDVTGSCVSVEYMDNNILVECGIHHAHSMLESYRINSKQFKFKVKKLDFVIVNHCHIDHIGLLPLLYARGCTAKLIVPKGNMSILYKLLENCAMIMDGDAKMLSKKFDKTFRPIYTKDDLNNMMKYIVEYDMYQEIELNKDIKIKYISSAHVANACSLILNINKNGTWKKIFYTSDLGNVKFKSYYVNNLDSIKNADVVISECTYGDKNRSCSNTNQREKDVERLKNVISQYCDDKNGKVLIPVFSFSRAQTIATILYETYKEDKNFNIPIYMDSMLLIEMNKIFRKQFPKFNNVMDWENIREIGKSDRKELMHRKGKAIILASSGMLSGGPSPSWLRSMVEYQDNCIVFCGYCSNGTLGAKLKLKSQKTVTLFGKKFKNKIQVVNLKSFSSHMQHDDLLKYLLNINCQTVALHHGDKDTKLLFKDDLENGYDKECKTTRVLIPNKSTKIRL